MHHIYMCYHTLTDDLEYRISTKSQVAGHYSIISKGQFEKDHGSFIGWGRTARSSRHRGRIRQSNTLVSSPITQHKFGDWFSIRRKRRPGGRYTLSDEFIIMRQHT